MAIVAGLDFSGASERPSQGTFRRSLMSIFKRLTTWPRDLETALMTASAGRSKSQDVSRVNDSIQETQAQAREEKEDQVGRTER